MAYLFGNGKMRKVRTDLENNDCSIYFTPSNNHYGSYYITGVNDNGQVYFSLPNKLNKFFILILSY